MPTLERLKAVGWVVRILFSSGRKMVHSAAFWKYNLCSQNFKYSMIKLISPCCLKYVVINIYEPSFFLAFRTYSFRH